MAQAQQLPFQPCSEVAIALQSDLFDALLPAPTPGTAGTQSTDGQHRADPPVSMQCAGHSDGVMGEPRLQAGTAFAAVIDAQL
mgnify:FL=1